MDNEWIDAQTMQAFRNSYSLHTLRPSMSDLKRYIRNINDKSELFFSFSLCIN